MEKKISFGFSKVSKKPNILSNKLVSKNDGNKIELIKGLEGQSIQLVKEKVEEAPLVIPLKDNRKTSAALLSLKTRQAVLNGEELPIQKEQDLPAIYTNKEDQADDTIEKRAAKELLAEVSKNQNVDGTDSKLVLPVKTDELPLDGAKESSIDDYESIPISQFGFAMLRGMGWKDVPKKAAGTIDDGLIVRPKGMGLGADKALKPKALLVAPEPNEVLEIKKGACIKVLGGKHKDLYGLIEGLDDHAGRVIVKMALGATKESFNEFMVQVVSKKEYAQYSKCINSAKYDEYKRRENAQGQIIIKKEEPANKEEKERDRNYIEDSSERKEEGNRKSPQRNHREDNYDRKYDRNRTSPQRNYGESSYERKDDRNRTSPQRNGSHNRPERSVRRSRSREKRSDYHSSSTSNKKYADRESPRRDRYKSSDSDSTDSSSHRSKHKKSSKKKKSKKSKDKSHDRRTPVSSSDEDRRYKKKTKKSKRGRSRSKCRR